MSYALEEQYNKLHDEAEQLRLDVQCNTENIKSNAKEIEYTKNCIKGNAKDLLAVFDVLARVNARLEALESINKDPLDINNLLKQEKEQLLNTIEVLRGAIEEKDSSIELLSDLVNTKTDWINELEAQLIAKDKEIKQQHKIAYTEGYRAGLKVY